MSLSSNEAVKGFARKFFEGGEQPIPRTPLNAEEAAALEGTDCATYEVHHYMGPGSSAHVVLRTAEGNIISQEPFKRDTVL